MAIRNNSDVTLDFILARRNQGMSFDFPLVALGEGRLNVVLNEEVTLPLTAPAARHPYGHMAMFVNYEYLPTVAEV